LSAESDKDNLIKLSFEIVDKIIRENLDAMKEVIPDLSLLLLKFAKNKNEDMAAQALEHFSKLIDQIVQNHKIIKKASGEIPEDEIETNKKEDKANNIYGISEDGWNKILHNLYKLSADSRKMINLKATVIIFDVLIKNGGDFSRDFWQIIMSGVIKPLFDEIHFSFQSKKASPKDKETQASKDFSNLAFSKIIELYNKYYDNLSYFTQDLFKIILNCILNPSEVLAKISLNALKDLIAKSHKNFGDSEWEQITEVFEKICKDTTPVQLMDQQIITKKVIFILQKVIL
jgi:brefeldin A-inhibited guanine nucleotide-exchange protein